jgi:oxygen-independent coproporphyrinogen-3 oxidase
LDQTFSIYIHVPFCRRRCPYCAFYSTDRFAAGEIRAYPRRILREFSLKSQDWRGFRLESVYFGGGTPSLLDSSDVARLLEEIKGTFQSSPNLEITLECNPGTVDAVSLSAFARAGVNRLSLGMQALDDKRLRFLGRIHDRDEALRTYRDARTVPELKVSVDLMVGTPSETEDSWDAELKELLSLDPEAISFYSLTVEEGTELAARYYAGETIYQPADRTVGLLLFIAGKLSEAGYRHYEVSNWALPGNECRHNLNYWRRGHYLGLGPSAHSFDGERRIWNLPDLSKYSEALDHEYLPPAEYEDLSEEDIRTEWVYLCLRQAEGLDSEAYRLKFGEPPAYWQVMFDKIAAAGLGEYNGQTFIPNDRGLLLADEIAARILG